MATKLSEFFQRLRTTLRLQQGETDGHLLGCLVDGRDEAAFAALVHRHGPLVWGVCRRLLNYHDAEDAFQATFLILFRKAASIRRRELLANWLYGVAHQTALQARRAAARRSAREKQVSVMADQAAAEPDPRHELNLLLDQELSCLPARYRTVIVLCDLEGKTRKEVAGLLGVPEGTVAGWLARGRTMLAKRLRRQGLTISGVALASVLAQKTASAGVPGSVVSGTMQTVALAAAGKAAASGTLSVPAAALAEGVLKTMLLTKLKIASAFLAAIVTMASAAGLVYKMQATQRPEDERVEKAATAQAANAEDPRRKAYNALLHELFKDEAAGKTGKRLRWGYFAPLFMKFAEENNTENMISCDAACWIVHNGKIDGPEFAQAMALLCRHHANGKWADYICQGLNAPKFFAVPSESIEGLFREVMKNNPGAIAQAEACFCLAQFLFNKAEFARVLRRPEAVDLARRIGECWGRDYLTQLKKVDPDKLDREASGFFMRGRALHARYWANHAALGKRAPEIKGKDVEGKFMALSDYRGKVVALTFWHPGCVPCMAAVPEERARVQRFAGQPFVMLGVVGNDDRARILKTIQEKQLNWRSWPNEDPERKGGTICAAWNVHGWGESFLLDQQGVIRYRNLGGTNMDFAVEALLIALKASEATGRTR